MPEFNEILKRARLRDERCMEQLWRNNQPVLFGWLFAMTHSKTLADDISSETWISAFNSLERFEGNERQFRSWIFTIARRRLIDMRRKDSILQFHVADEIALIAEHVKGESKEIDHNYLLIETAREAIEVVRGNLPPEQSEVILLRVIGGLDTAQTAEVLGKTPGAIRVLQHRGLKNLAKHYVHANERSSTQIKQSPTSGEEALENSYSRNTSSNRFGSKNLEKPEITSSKL